MVSPECFLDDVWRRREREKEKTEKTGAEEKRTEESRAMQNRQTKEFICAGCAGLRWSMPIAQPRPLWP